MTPTAANFERPMLLSSLPNRLLNTQPHMHTHTTRSNIKITCVELFVAIASKFTHPRSEMLRKNAQNTNRAIERDRESKKICSSVDSHTFGVHVLRVLSLFDEISSYSVLWNEWVWAVVWVIIARDLYDSYVLFFGQPISNRKHFIHALLTKHSRRS